MAVTAAQTEGRAPAAPGPAPLSERQARRNITLAIVEIVCFSLAMAFTDSGTVLAGFVTSLTASPVLLGLAPTVFQIGLGLPGLAVAGFLSRRPRKMPFLIGASIARNIPYFVLAAVAWSRPQPSILLATFFVCYLLFALGMGMEAVAWLDIFAKVCPPDRRGRVFALGRTVANVLSFGAGFLVAGILTAEGGFPRNYAILFLLAGLLLTAALIVFSRVREPVEPAADRAGEDAGPGRRAIVAQGRDVWRADGRFRRFLAARVLAVAHLVALPFYLRFARDVVGIDDAAIGRFVSASMAGQIAANLLWGAIGDRFGHRRVVQAVLALGALLPLYALLTPHLPHPHGAFLVVYVVAGAILAGDVLGWMNLLLDLAPPARRPLYVSLQSALLLPANLLPLLGGVALRVVPYGAFFPAIALALAAGLWTISRGGAAPRIPAAAP